MNANTPTESQDLAELIHAGSSAKHSRRRWIVIVGIAVLLLGAGIFLRARGRGAEGPQYVTSPVERGSLGLTVTATGNIEPTNEVTVGSELSGTTLEVLVETNDRVTKGQPLAKLDTRKLFQQAAISRASLASAKAKVILAQATLTESETTLDRAEELKRISGGKVPSKAEMDTATATVDRARADLLSTEAAVDEGKAKLESDETDIAKATIAAPIDGTVLTRSLEPGQTVAANFTAPELFVIAENLERMKLEVAVAEADIGGVKPGQSATFTVDAWPDRSYTAKVVKAAYGSSVTDNVVTYETELEVANDDLSLRPGMTATVDIRTAVVDDVLLVPSAALRFEPAATGTKGPRERAPKKSFLDSIVPRPPRGEKKAKPADAQTPKAPESNPAAAKVWVLRDGRPEAIPVKTGLTNGRLTEVSGPGLDKGMPVIIRVATTPAS